MKLHIVPVAVVAAGAAAALGISLISPVPVDRDSQVTPPLESRVYCQPLGDGELLASGQGKVVTAQYGGEENAPRDVVREPTKALTTVRGIAPTGGVLGADGIWAPCQAPATSGTVLWPDASKAELRLTNPDATDASVDLILTGPDGEISAVGARDIALSPGQTRQVAVSVLARGVDGPVVAHWSTSRGRALAVGVTAGTVHFASPSTTPATEHTLPGLARGGKPTVLIANPGEERATASVAFHGPSSTFTPSGGEDISIPARSVVAVALDAGTAGEPGAFTVESDVPVAASLHSATGDADAASGGAVQDSALTGVVPAGSTLQLTNLGASRTKATVTLDGAEQEAIVEPGTTGTLPVSGEGGVAVSVAADQPLVGAAVTKKGAAVVPLGAGTVVEAKPLTAKLDPTLR